jgi:hypothetical protein
VLAITWLGWIALGFGALMLWVLLAFWPAQVAERKGHSFVKFFCFSLLFFPAAVIAAYAVEDRGTSAPA